VSGGSAGGLALPFGSERRTPRATLLATILRVFAPLRLTNPCGRTARRRPRPTCWTRSFALAFGRSKRLRAVEGRRDGGHRLGHVGRWRRRAFVVSTS